MNDAVKPLVISRENGFQGAAAGEGDREGTKGRTGRKDGRESRRPTRGCVGPCRFHSTAWPLRELNRTPGANFETFRMRIEHADPAICVNVIIALIKPANYLLDRQIGSLEQAFLKNGGRPPLRRRARNAREVDENDVAPVHASP